jgi:glycine/D-amino acid oxidase-like deaminating enzyme/nitrite reductase/ring-hydroxylating ferredoxin subunit
MQSVATHSFWQESASIPRLPALDRDLRVDVVVVGGGVTGITAAYLLSKHGLRVALLERGRLLEQDTAHTSAHLTSVTDSRLTRLAKDFGRDHAGAVWDAGLAALGAIDEYVREEGIDCGFAWVPGYLHLPFGRVTQADTDAIRAEAELARDLGFDAEFQDRTPLTGTPGLQIPDQARVHPLKYLAGLLRAARGRRCEVFEMTAVEAVEDDPPAVIANGRRVICDRVVVATHNPVVGSEGFLKATAFQTKLALYTSYVVGGYVPHGSVPDALFWDTGDPYRYLRLVPWIDKDLVIYGGEDHKTGQSSDTTMRFERLEQALRALLPHAALSHRWSGQVIETHDGLPYIGETAARQFVATGFGGNGLTFGTLGAMMATDWILGGSNPWRGLFDAGRTNVRRGIWNYITENADYPYYLVRDRFAGRDGANLRSIPRGEGRVIDLDGKAAAVYRAIDGSVTARSAVCTHMGCLVRWNAAGQSWDCPCHGSRFAPDGGVMAGPAEAPLSPIARATEQHSRQR